MCGSDRAPGVSRWRRLGRWARRSEAALGARLVLASGSLLGLVFLLGLHANQPDLLGVNAHVYYLAGEAVRTGGDLYAVAPPGFPQFGYVYPPVVAVAFVPYALLGSPGAAFAAHTAVAVAGSLLLARLLVRLAEGDGRPLPRADRLLVAAFCVASVHSAPSLYYGNVNLLLVLALAGAVVWLARSPARAGALFAVPAIVKAFPALLGVWLLRMRNWRTVAGAAVAGLAATAASLALFGLDAHRAYLVSALLPRRRTADFVGGLDPNAGYLTLRRPLSILLPDADPVVLAVLSGLVLLPVAAYLLAADVDDPPGDLLALHGTIAATLLVLPSYQTYFVFLFVTLVPLLYRLPPGPARSVFVAGALVANVAITPAGVGRVLGPPLAGRVLDVLTPILTVGSPRLYGTLLTLAGCVLYVRRRRAETAAAGP